MAEDGNLVDGSEGALAQQPPATNQGGSNTSNQQRSLWRGMDYLTASMPEADDSYKKFASIAQLFESSGEVNSFEHGYEGMDVCGACGQVMVRKTPWSPYAGDVLVRLPGRALEWLRDGNLLSLTDSETTDADICRFFVDHEFRSTRLDITMDSNDERINPFVIRKFLDQESFTCSAKSAGLAGRWKLRGQKVPGDGETIYIGGRTSSRFMRIYDKRADVLRRLGKDIGHMTRFELEHKGEAATKMMKLLAEHGSQCIPGVMAGWINFKDPNDDATRVERRRNIDWWEDLITGANVITLGLSRNISKPEKSVHWIKHQVSKTLYLLKKFGLMEEVDNAIKNHEFRIRPSELKQWSEYVARMKLTVKPLTQ